MRLAVEVDDDARGILQAEHLPGGRRALEGHAERGGAARLAELGGRHQPVPDRPGARPAAGAHVGERDRQPAALGLDQPGLDRRVRLEDHPRVGGVRADAELDAGGGPGRRARRGGRGRIRLGPRRLGRARHRTGGAGGRRGRDLRRRRARRPARRRGAAARRRRAARWASRRRGGMPRASRTSASPARRVPTSVGSARARRSLGTRQVPWRTRTGAASDTGCPSTVTRRASRATWTTP